MRRNSCVLAQRLCVLSVVIALASAVPLSAADPEPTKTEVKATEEKFEQLLERPINVDFTETPLTEVVEFLHDLTGSNLLIDRTALAEAGVADDTPITIKAKGVRLRAVLHRILSEHSLTFAIRDEALLVTTLDGANSLLATKIHPAKDILPDVAEDELADHVTLLKTAVQSLDQAAWDDVGGPASASVYRRQLVINAATEMQHKVHGLLTLLRAARPQNAAGPLPLVLRDESPQEKQVRSKLDLPADADFQEVPLTEVVAFLSDRFGVNISIDRTALTNAGIAADTPVTLKVGKMSLRSLLGHILRGVKLAYHIEDDMLVVTTPDTQLSLAVYPIGDLETLTPGGHPAGQGLGLPQTGAEDLVAMITSQIAPSSWEDVGGAGSIHVLCTPPVLVVRQTEGGHQALQDLLTQLRGKAPAGPPAASRPVEKVYVLVNLGGLMAFGREEKPAPMPTADELAKVIQELIEPGSWKEGAVYVKPLTGRLIVKHHPATQRRIEKLLSELNVILVSPTGGPFGGVPGGVGFGGGLGGVAP